MTYLDTHDRALIRRIAQRWPHLATLADRALGRLCGSGCNCQVCADLGWECCEDCSTRPGNSAYARQALHALATSALRGEQGPGWGPRETLRIVRWEEGA